MIELRLVKIEDLQTLSEIYTIVYNTLNIGEKWDYDSAYK